MKTEVQSETRQEKTAFLGPIVANKNHVHYHIIGMSEKKKKNK